jgi:hypothetical protein
LVKKILTHGLEIINFWGGKVRSKIFINCVLTLLILIIPITVFAGVTISVTPTSDIVLAGSVRSIYANVQGNADTSVTWTASCGTKVDSMGFTTWTAPASGTCTVTAMSNADNTQSASATFTITTATVRVSNIPMQSTIYKNQPLIVQSILWGSTNTAVKWSTSGGTLTGTGREVVFKSSTAGTFTITSISAADNTKTAVTTIVVTNNNYPAAATANHTMPIDCTATGNGTTYDITATANFDSVPWPTLGAGDTVRIHNQGSPYYKQILLSTSGTTSQPIRICGVPDGNGNLPEINGANATAYTGALFGTGSGDIQSLGGITFYTLGTAYYGGANYPQNIIIEGLKLNGFNSGNTYTDLSTGSVTAYNSFAACIRVQRGGNITIRGNDITGCGNGIFAETNNGVESEVTRNLLVEGNYIHGNGVNADYGKHQVYLQPLGLVLQGNYFDLPLSGSLGAQVKTRAVQQFIRYNYFEPAAVIFDLVEIQDSPALVFPWVGLDPGELVNTSTTDVVANYEAYQDRYVYGNIVHNIGNVTASSVIWGSADNDQTYQAGGILYFYHNTVLVSLLSGHTSNWRQFIVNFGNYDNAINTHTTFPSAQLTNNAFYIEPSSTGQVFSWNVRQPDRVKLDKNWVSNNWGTGNTAGGDGTGISNSAGDLASAVWQGGSVTTQVNGISSLISDSTQPFSSSTYLPTSSGALTGSSASLAGKEATLPPLMQYSPATYLMSVRSNTNDMGAVGYNNGLASPQPPQLY